MGARWRTLGAVTEIVEALERLVCDRPRRLREPRVQRMLHLAGGWQVADKRGLGMRVKRPQGNALVLAILRSSVHRLLSGLAVELRYTGRRSGRTYALPVQYVRTGDRLVLWPQGADRKSWWRNFRTPGR